MAISKLGGVASDNWELISSVVPTPGATAVNFTSLATYKKLLVVVDNAQSNVSAQLLLRLNNDSGAGQYWYSAILDTGNVAVTTATNWPLNNSATNHYAFMIISSCDTNGLKMLDNGGGSDTDRNFFSGFYKASAAVSQVNVVLNSSFFNVAGTIALYGVK